MKILLSSAVLINSILLLFSLVNAFSIRRATESGSTLKSFSLLIPCRNEDENIEDLVANLAALSHPQHEIIFINDNSSDQTFQLLTAATSKISKMRVIDAPPLPSGWMGKPWALQQGLGVAKNEFIVTIDADVRLTASALESVDLLLVQSGLDFTSPYPAQNAVTLPERLIQPLLQWTWMTTVPLRIAEKSSRPSLAVANGQFFFIRHSALTAIGGFSSIKNCVLDDIELARALLRNGFKGGVSDGSKISHTRMYSSFSQIRSGYAKSLSIALGGIFGSTLLISLLMVTGILPFLLAFSGSELAAVALLIGVASRIVSAASTRGVVIDSFLHPISSLFFIYLIIYSLFFRSRITWKGRSV
jgi:cellulose synthase/poly-beta-1,6-N-acetylglucosamine synthase-like glycosyltransferase